MYKCFSFKWSPNFTDFQCFIFQFGGSKFFWVAKWWGVWILGPCGSIPPPNWGYGVRLIRLCL